jgi:hypothetical protein
MLKGLCEDPEDDRILMLPPRCSAGSVRGSRLFPRESDLENGAGSRNGWVVLRAPARYVIGYLVGTQLSGTGKCNIWPFSSGPVFLVITK